MNTKNTDPIIIIKPSVLYRIFSTSTEREIKLYFNRFYSDYTHFFKEAQNKAQKEAALKQIAKLHATVNLCKNEHLEAILEAGGNNYDDRCFLLSTLSKVISDFVKRYAPEYDVFFILLTGEIYEEAYFRNRIA